MAYEDCKVTRLPTDSDNIVFGEWTIGYSKSHILKSVCIRNENACSKDDPDQCELCTYRNSLELPHLPDMVFHKNKMSLIHKSGAELYFTPLEALKLVENGKQSIQVACADEWKESRPEQHLQEKFKPFDWTFSTDYQGTLNEKFRVEETDKKIDIFKLMQQEKILFYHDLTLFEDELHDHGVATLSVKIRVMPSGFFVLLRYFLRVDNVMIKMNDTRFHYEIENDFILKEYTSREAKIEELKNVPPPLFTIPNEIEKSLPIRIKKSYKLFFK
ncbi:TIP41-like protein isoform X1 [Condylostylus longicornis]|uniref:TIP41-like protein isoform X1 n=1 Tax=Condylostylus longicornis TaxID=2530218 RepID=UPI00244DC64B|nr:TIP41-like protein isoform X1 [Condylostylus longicornis]